MIVIVCEDNPVHRSLLGEELRTGLGAKVVPAASLAELTELRTTVEADVIVLDLGLPDSDPSATVAAIPAMLPATVVVFTAHDYLLPLAYQAGAARCVVKPTTMGDILAAVASEVDPGWQARHLDAAERRIARVRDYLDSLTGEHAPIEEGES